MAENCDFDNVRSQGPASTEEHTNLSKRPRLNPDSTSTWPLSSPNGIKRLFPGPAGLLTSEHDGLQPTQLCSQTTSSVFQEEGSWKQMAKHFEVRGSGHLFDQFNIAWIKGQAKANKFTIQKTPFLAGLLVSLDIVHGQTQKSINVTLRDLTGTIRGNIVQSLYEEYEPHFTVGSVLVLVQFGVLSCSCDQCDNYHLTITQKNLSAIYGQENLIIRPISPEEILEGFQRTQQEFLRKTSAALDSRPVFPRPGATLLDRKRAECASPDRSGKPMKKLFTFKKSGGVHMKPSVPKPPDIIETKKSSSSELSNADHEQLWKDMLTDVDLKALFEEDL